jgi:pyridoxal 5'-phosphate synthase pdxT subunit
MVARRVGVLAFQGDFERHIRMLARLGAEAFELITLEDLASAQAVVIPGGESTVMGKFLVRFGMLEPLRARIIAGMPAFGTCAGLILLARRIVGYDQPALGVLDVEVKRNAYGRQVESFETDIPTSIPGEESARAVFIRAPIITTLGEGVKVLAEFEGNPVLVRQGNVLAGAFHPELTEDPSIHRYFLGFPLPA